MNQRVQLIRALAILAVVAIHTPAPEPYVVFIRPFLNFAVAMFLFLSALLTAEKAQQLPTLNYRTLVTGRLKRLLPPYAIWVVLSSLPSILQNPSCTLGSALGNMFYQAWGVPYYFFLVYMQLILLHPLMARLAASRYRLAGFAITPLALCCLYAARMANIPLPGLSYAIPFPVWFGYYYLGIILGQQKNARSPRLAPCMALWCASIILQAAEAWIWYAEGVFGTSTSQLKLTSFLSSTAACLLAYAFIRRPVDAATPGAGQALLICIGNCSMGIFLCHCLIIRVWQKAASFLHLPTPYPTDTVAVLLLSLLLIAGANRLLPRPCTHLLGLACGRAKAGR